MRKDSSAGLAPVAVVGLGAVGGVLAASLRRSGLRVLVSTRTALPPGAGRGGLTVRDPEGRTSRVAGLLALGAADAPSAGCEALFLCVKAPDLRRALRSTRRLAGPGTAVVSLLNGVTHRSPMLRAFGPSRCVFGAAYFAARRLGPGSVWHTGGDRVVLARTPANGRAVLAARRLLTLAGWRVSVVSSEERLLWTKAVFNAAVNPLGALTRGSNASLARHPALRELLSQVAAEAARAVRAAGHPLLPGDPAREVVRANRPLVHQFNSMVQDLEAGRRTEAEAILKPILAAARRSKTPSTRLEPLYLMVRRLEKELCR